MKPHLANIKMEKKYVFDGMQLYMMKDLGAVVMFINAL